ncbi:hypothetical protein [Yoonia sp. I 8.24]|uniref:hypothetical protein n=1 Tax=Yoonia sp. I 8.24 TaxID=1537229 RepID=UPI001EDD22F5|nr:hypothetical protein [Yoonia sp. I 8.24]MCG3266692.1 hypothetical protein [Yoonia sp. I 8.24]
MPVSQTFTPIVSNGVSSRASRKGSIWSEVRGLESERFVNEGLALALSKYYMLRAENDADFQDGAVKNIWRIARRLTSCISPRERNVGDASVENLDVLIVGRIGTKVSIATNIIQCAVVQKFRLFSRRDVSSEKVVDDKLLEDAIVCVISNTNFLEVFNERFGFNYCFEGPVVEQVICSELIFRYLIVGCQILKSEDFWYPSKQQDIETLFRPSSRSTYYDSWRYPKLKELSEKVLTEK